MIILFAILIICCIFLMCRDVHLSEKLKETILECESYKTLCQFYERKEMGQKDRQGSDRKISEREE